MVNGQQNIYMTGLNAYYSIEVHDQENKTTTVYLRDVSDSINNKKLDYAKENFKNMQESLSNAAMIMKTPVDFILNLIKCL